MAGTDWSKPLTTDGYASVLSELESRDVSVATQFNTSLAADTNIPTDAIQWDATNLRWNIWGGASWGPLASVYNITVANATNLTGSGTVSATATGGAGLVPTNATNATNLTGSGTVSATATGGAGLVPTNATNAANVTAIGDAAAFDARYLIPPGTRMSFNQTAAPSGWTKDTTVQNDSIMRIVTGTVSQGGSTAFSTFNAQTATAAYTLALADIPSHGHTVTDPGHSHAYGTNPGAGAAGGGTPIIYGSTGGSYSTSTVVTGISINANGGGGAHSHGITTAIKYHDFIIASKN